MSNEQPLEGASPVPIVLGSAVNGDLRSNDQGFGARFAIYTKLDPVTKLPVIDARAVGPFQPEHLRMLDRQQPAPGGHADIHMGIQVWADYGQNHHAAREGDAGFGQSNVFSSANPSTRVADSKGRESIFPSIMRLVGDEADLYTLALTCPFVPLSPPDGKGAVDKEPEDVEEEQAQEDGPTKSPPILGPVTPPPGVAWNETPGLERVTILRNGNTFITFNGKPALTAAKAAARKPRANADTVFAEVSKAVPIQGRTDGQKFESHRDELSGGLHQFGLDLTFVGVGSSSDRITGAEVTSSEREQLLADAKRAAEQAAIERRLGNNTSADNLERQAADFRAQAATVGQRGGSAGGPITGIEIKDSSLLKQVQADVWDLRERARIEANLGNTRSAANLAKAANDLEARASDAISRRAIALAKADADRAKASADRKKKQ